MDERERSFPPACVSLWNQQYRISHLYNRMLTTVHFCVAFSDNIPLVHENPAPGRYHATIPETVIIMGEYTVGKIPERGYTK